MNIVIIAAGKGSRIYKKVKKNKQLIKINNEILLETLIKNAISCRFKKIFIVVGFKSYNIINTLNKYKEVKFIKNNLYNKKEMLYSIISGLRYSLDDTIVSYSDIIYKKNLLVKIKRNKTRNILIPINLNWKNIWKIRNKNIYKDAETLQYSKNKELKNIGNKITKKKEPSGQFMGLIYFPKNKIKKVINYYKKTNSSKMQTTSFLNILIKKNEKIKVLPTKSFWYEFDDYEDFTNYKKKFN